MTMSPLHQYLPDIAAAETRSAFVRGIPGLPDAQYGFMESYCVDPACDCRRVLITVIRTDMPGKILATINYGWESAKFYGRWVGNMADAAAAKGPTLDRFNPQSAYSRALLTLFTELIQDRAYEQRFKRHYTQMKARIKAEHAEASATAKPQPAPAPEAKVRRGRRG